MRSLLILIVALVAVVGNEVGAVKPLITVLLTAKPNKLDIERQEDGKTRYRVDYGGWETEKGEVVFQYSDGRKVFQTVDGAAWHPAIPFVVDASEEPLQSVLNNDKEYGLFYFNGLPFMYEREEKGKGEEEDNWMMTSDSRKKVPREWVPREMEERSKQNASKKNNPRTKAASFSCNTVGGRSYCVNNGQMTPVPAGGLWFEDSPDGSWKTVENDGNQRTVINHQSHRTPASGMRRHGMPPSRTPQPGMSQPGKPVVNRGANGDVTIRNTQFKDSEAKIGYGSNAGDVYMGNTKIDGCNMEIGGRQTNRARHVQMTNSMVQNSVLNIGCGSVEVHRNYY